jgi:hypothetical protein
MEPDRVAEVAERSGRLRILLLSLEKPVTGGAATASGANSPKMTRARRVNRSIDDRRSSTLLESSPV